MLRKLYSIFFFYLLPFAISSRVHNISKDDNCISSICAINEDSLRFYFFGDFGGQNDTPFTTDIQLSVAHALDKMDKEAMVHFYLTCGDNIYKEGVKDEYDLRFKITFEDVYNKPGHYRPWYLTAGNHDYNGNISGQIEYSRHSWRWNYPDYYYSFQYKLKPSDVTAEFLMVDTILLCGNINSTHDDTTVGPKDPKLAEEHWRWIENKLKGSTANYLFVIGHYPLWSRGYHGPTPLLDPRMISLMRQYNASAYLAGHDHNLQHIIEENEKESRINMIISGMGAQSDLRRHQISDLDAKVLFIYPDWKIGQSNNNSTEPRIQLYTDKGGFVVANVTKTLCKLVYYDSDGVQLYSHFISPRY